MIVDWVRSLGPWSWIILGVVLIGLELLSPGAFLIWLGLAALATGLVGAVLDLSWQASALLFAVSSVAAVLMARLINASSTNQADAADGLNRRGEVLVGQVFKTNAPIIGGEGRIRVGDSSWRVTGPDAATGTSVRVVRVDGATLVVEPA